MSDELTSQSSQLTSHSSSPRKRIGYIRRKNRICPFFLSDKENNLIGQRDFFHWTKAILSQVLQQLLIITTIYVYLVYNLCTILASSCMVINEL